MTDDIKLPSLPGDQGLQDPFIRRSLQAYGHASIKYDRLKRENFINDDRDRLRAEIVALKGTISDMESDRQQRGEPVNIDDLAQEIRRVDGNHDLGAGRLAEALMPFLLGKIAQQQPATNVVPVDPPGDNFGSAEHWKEKAQYWADEAHKARQQSLRGLLAPQPAAPVQNPSDEDLLDMWYEIAGSGKSDEALEFAYALLDRYGP